MPRKWLFWVDKTLYHPDTDNTFRKARVISVGRPYYFVSEISCQQTRLFLSYMGVSKDTQRSKLSSYLISKPSLQVLYKFILVLKFLDRLLFSLIRYSFGARTFFSSPWQRDVVWSDCESRDKKIALVTPAKPKTEHLKRIRFWKGLQFGVDVEGVCVLSL